MYIIIAVAIAVVMPSTYLIKRLEARTVTGHRLLIMDPPFQKGVSTVRGSPQCRRCSSGSPSS